MAVGIGASSSNLLGGIVVQRAGYQAGFATMAGIAAVALIVFWCAMPETKQTDRVSEFRTDLSELRSLSQIANRR